MKETIPARTVLRCDFCKREDTGNGFFKMATSIHLRRSALDMNGDPAADASQTFDACDDCAIKICNQINIFAAGFTKSKCKECGVEFGHVHAPECSIKSKQ